MGAVRASNLEHLLSTDGTFETEARRYSTGACGGRLRSIRATRGVEFLERFSGPIGMEFGLVDAWGSFEARTKLIGVCALARVSATAFRIQVAVVPERRRLGVGGELLSIAIQRASEGGGRMLVGSYPAGAIGARCLVESLQLVSARRVRHGRAEVVLFMPTPASEMSGGGT
jgi:GNAT superfamily N-acetyltransferase